MFRLPCPDERVLIIGSTGSGKTRQGIWLHAFRNFRKYPNIIFDFKGDDLIDRLPRAEIVELKKNPPKQPGLYIVKVLPNEDELLSEYFWKIWKQEKTGIYIDEGSMLPNHMGRYAKSFNAILTQGRSKKIPVITLTQRPAYISNFLYSESSFYSIFRVQNGNDLARVADFVPVNTPEFNFNYPLAKYHSRWYSVNDDYGCIMRPVPKDDVILQLYEDALKKRIIWR